jgi:hypothetical protein
MAILESVYQKINYITFEIVSFVKWFKYLDLRFFIFRALFCNSLVLKVIRFDRVAVLICSVAIFC